MCDHNHHEENQVPCEPCDHKDEEPLPCDQCLDDFVHYHNDGGDRSQKVSPAIVLIVAAIALWGGAFLLVCWIA